MNDLESNPRLPRTVAALERGRQVGWHLGAQLYVSRAGAPVANLAVGESRPGQPMADDTLLLWLSSSKPITALAMLQLVERGRCRLDDAVAAHLAEFAQGGKQDVTIRHLLTHTSGFRWVENGGKPAPWDEVIDRICRAKLEPRWTPGARAGYHPYSSWYILGELIHRIDGRMPDVYVRQEIFEPLGMHDCWLSLSPHAVEMYGARIGPLYATEKPERPLHLWSTPAGLLHCAPGATGRGPMSQLAHFYEALLNGGSYHGTRVLQADTVEQMTSRQRLGMFDETFKNTIDWGWGVIVNSRTYNADVQYGYGRWASPGTFGHSGHQSSVALADPQHALVVALAFNGMPGEKEHQARVYEVLDTLYEELGLAG